MKNLTKREISTEIFLETKGEVQLGMINKIVQLTLDKLSNALGSGRNVELRNFGVLAVQVRKPRIGRNPTKPSSEVVIPKRAVVKFKPGKMLKAKLKQIDLSSVEEAKISRSRK